MDITRFAPTSIRSSLSAVLGGVGGLFEGSGPVYQATLSIDADAALPGDTELLAPGKSTDALVRLGRVDDFRTVCIKVPAAYGPGRDQDLLLASSADGIPFHHAVLPAEHVDSRLYSSLWLYLAGFEPVAFGLRADTLAHPDGVTQGDQFGFLVSSAVGRFRPIGNLTIEAEFDGPATHFAGRNNGGGLRALPPALFYRD